eukprot:2025181-Pleurochrysis_carterae.AAC.1
MEGSKGGTRGSGKFFTGKRSAQLRWNDYTASRIAKSLPVVGSYELFRKLWASHTEIVQYSAKSHPVCDECGKHQSRIDQMEGRTDEMAVAERKAIADAEVCFARDTCTSNEG